KDMGFLIGVPIVIMIIISVVFMVKGYYPFGNGTIAWCDMTQQVIPMTANLEDILSGKTGFFLNMQNAGGMSMIGVVFFFVASPLNLLAFVVPKQDLVLFVNVLTMLKLMAAGMTAMLFFRKCFEKLSPFFAAFLSISYAFCGYAVVYYQNSIWLDVMYLFPLLMIGIHRLITKNKLLPYVVTLSIMAVVNYYICYMIAVFCILFFALICVRDKKNEYKQAGFLFLIGSLIAALITAVVWLPSLLQYFVSGRTTSISENLKATSFLSEHQTATALLLYSTVAIVICAVCIIDKRRRTKQNSTMLIMLTLMLIPMYAEPINLMWHTGSYMSFPCRYAFITVFLMLICSAQFIEDGSEHIAVSPVKSRVGRITLPVFCFALLGASVLLTDLVIRRNETKIMNYSRSLWSDDTFLGIEFKIFFVFAAAFAVVFLLYKKAFLGKRVFTVLLGCFVVAQSVTALNMYVTSNKDYSIEKAQETRSVFALDGKIKDDSFYRVKTTGKHFDVNNIGAMGYRSLSHYTSLTDRAYMYAMKKLGYSSYWMEVGSHGGTEFTDALFSVKYKIAGEPLAEEKAVVSTDKYSVYERENYIGLGLITDRDISDMESFDDLDRFEVQQDLYRTLFAENDSDDIITKYEPESTNEVIYDQDDDEIELMPFGKTNEMNYSFFVKGRQVIYFDCFDKLSSNLYEDINGSFTITINNTVIQTGYPSQASNGLLRLGVFENCQVKIDVEVLKNVRCTSFGIYGLDMDKLDKVTSNARCADLDEKQGVISGSCEASEGDKCVLFVPYSKTFNVEINGEKVSYEKAFDDFIAFDLKDGTNDIRITAEPMGLTAGIFLSVFGVLVAVGSYLLRKKVELDDVVYAVCRGAVIVIGILTFIVIYIYPVIINCTGPHSEPVP
ncbi:MAG: YfhO family protein, partial [Ruminococcus sp.]|nr:YfhO family protein [Ruminococcus sp.]